MISQIYTIGVILTIINVVCGVSGADEIDVSKCKTKITTTMYKYQTYPIGEIKNKSAIFFEFNVKADRDALLIFSSHKAPITGDNNVFEVVIGGHENTRSMIRETVEKGEEQSRFQEKGILSSTEWRQFWIRISLDGSSIEVGKKGSTKPFLSLQKAPRTIEYYGFASWEKRVEWAFQCPDKDEIERKIIQKIFNHYDASIMPTNDGTILNQTNITFESRTTHFPDLDFVVINGTANITWKDKRLSWNPAEYFNTSSISDKNGSAWKPHIGIKNCSNELGDSISPNSGNVTISDNGSVTWTTPLCIKLPCLPRGKNPHKPQLICQIELTNISTKIEFKFLNNSNLTFDDSISKASSLTLYDYVKYRNQHNKESEFTVELIYRKHMNFN